MKISIIVLSILLGITVIFIGAFWAIIDNLTYQLASVENDLVATQNNLQDISYKFNVSQSHLNETRNLLENAINLYADVQNQLISKSTQLSITEWRLTETKLLLEETQRKLTASIAENSKFLKDYSSLREQVNLRGGIGKNGQQFITPKDPSVSAKVTEIAGGHSQDVDERWLDYKLLYDWVVKNIESSNDSLSPFLPESLSGEVEWYGECWRMPEETLEDKTGDCEDMALLLASMLLNYNDEKYSIWAISIQGEDTGHLAVAIPVAGGELSILDPAGNFYTGQYASWLLSDDADKAVKDWLSHWRNDMPNARVTSVFSKDFYREFTSTEEFITWAKERWTDYFVPFPP